MPRCGLCKRKLQKKKRKSNLSTNEWLSTLLETVLVPESTGKLYDTYKEEAGEMVLMFAMFRLVRHGFWF
jgi:hypothetical protein